jgi:chloramphenicol-sensitive protein RarD
MPGTMQAESTCTDAPREARIGVMYGVAAYLWWGFCPIYFKEIAHIDPVEVLAHRIAWSVILLALMLRIYGRLRAALATLRHRATLTILVASTIVLAANWLTFIYAVSTNRVMHASLGYFMNPLVNVMLGFVFLGERLSAAQWLSVVLAGSGVLYMALMGNTLPWIALVLAFSFGFYGLLRKTARADALVGLSIETWLLAPLALIYLAFLSIAGTGNFGATGWRMDLLLMLGGVVTTVPLLWFANAARRLKLATIGFLQYIAPSLQFLLAVALFQEVFTRDHGISFGLIWVALGVYSIDAIRRKRA